MSTDKTVPKGGKICVTGAAGFIGLYIVEKLFERGYKVRAVVRDVKNEEKNKYLKALAPKPEQLELFEADLSANKYDEAFEGCDAVIHVASPYIYSAKDPQKEIVDPAVEGAKSVLLAAAKSPSVKRIVFTSSGGAVIHFPVPPKYKFTQSDWNTQATLQTNAYFLSKKLAEEAIWNLHKEHSNEVDLVVVNPLLVFGPPKTPFLNVSQSNFFQKMMLGQPTPGAPPAAGITDVRDVAEAHIIALEHPKAVGQRLFCCSCTVTWKQITEEAKKQFPEYNVIVETNNTPQPDWTIDTTPLQELGLKEFIPFEKMIKDTVEGLISVGAIPDLRKKN